VRGIFAKYAAEEGQGGRTGDATVKFYFKMSHPSDDETRVVLRKLAYFIASFYVLYYAVALVYILGFDLPFERFGYIPFNFEEEDFKPALRGRGELDRELPLGKRYYLLHIFLPCDAYFESS
jgi:hypothetical protein